MAENDDLFFVDVPPVQDGQQDSDNELEKQPSHRLQAPPIPGTTEALIEENDNAAALAELEDVPMAAKRKRTIIRGPKLDSKRLLSARGLPALLSNFKDVKLKGKGHEEENLEIIMSTLEHWTHRLYPKLTFDDCLEKIEVLGQKREVQTCMKKVRMGMPLLDDNNQTTVITTDGPIEADDENDHSEAENVILDSDIPSTSYIDIFPVRTSSSQQRSNVDESAEEGESTLSRSSLDRPRSPAFPAGFNPADYGTFGTEN